MHGESGFGYREHPLQNIPTRGIEAQLIRSALHGPPGYRLFSVDYDSFEGSNNKAKVVTRRSYGFRTTHTLTIALFHTLDHLPEREQAYRFA